MDKPSRLLYGINDKPPFFTAFMLALQYVLLNLGSIMLTPIIIGNVCGLTSLEVEYMVFVTILVCAVSTFIQVKRWAGIGSGYLMILGPSGAFLSCSMMAVNMGGLPLLGGMTLLSAPLEAGIAFCLRFVRKIFTPALGGTVIMLVAVLMVPISFALWSGEKADPLFCSPAYFVCGLVPVLIILGSYLSDKAWVRLWSPIIGMLLGVAVAYPFGIADFSRLGQYPLLAVPRMGWPGIDLSLRHLPLFITFLMATLASTIETFGDTVALQNVSEEKFGKIQYDRVQGGMYVDTVGSMLSGLACTTANTTYSTVMPVIQLTRVSSRYVGYLCAVIIGVCAFLPKFAYFFLCIPNPVLGGMSVALMAILFGEGFKVAASAEMNAENGVVIGVGMGMGLLAVTGGFFPNLFPPQFRFVASDIITMGGLSALVLNSFFIYKVRKTEKLRIAADLTLLGDLRERVEVFKGRFRMTERQLYALQLACEEVFSFFCAQNPATAQLAFRWKYHPDYIITEIYTTGELTDVDTPPDLSGVMAMDEASVQALGLLLLARVATNVEHATIGGHHYISFRVPAQ